MNNELQKKLDEELAHTKRICKELLETMASCVATTDRINNKLDRIIEDNNKFREENKNA